MYRKIAIFVSGAGEATERIVRLFNEGNRVHIPLVFVDDSAISLRERLQDEDINIIHIPDNEWHEKTAEVVDMLRENNINLIVSDDFALAIPIEIMETTDGQFLKLSSAEAAPREVVNALEAELRKPRTEDTPQASAPAEENPSMESEWADALKIQFTPPKVPTTPPELPKQPSENLNRGYQETRYPHHDSREPMPSTWLIWSILVTVFCCFIPGIIAIIFSSQVSSRYYAGDIEGARRSSRMAEIWIIVSFVLGVLAATLYLPFMMIGW